MKISYDKWFSPRAETQRRQLMYASLIFFTSQSLLTKVQIVCKFFIEAIETEKYAQKPIVALLFASHYLFRFGWFWECPNGEKCQYRHALPPGFMLKSQRKAAEEAEKANTITLEEFLEVEVTHNTLIEVDVLLLIDFVAS